MRAILHIGLPRTGTTTLQAWLTLNDDVLRRAGLGVAPILACHRLAADCLPDTLVERQDVVGLRQAMSLDDAIAAATASPSDVTLLSSEYFFPAAPDRVARRLAGIGMTIEAVVCFLRRQDDLCASSYCHNVLSIGASQPVRDMGYDPALDWNALFDRWQSAFPAADLRFVNYDKAAAGGLVACFRRVLDIGSVATATPEARLNASVSAEIAEVARMANERSLAFAPEALVAQSSHAAPRFGFHHHVVARFEAAFLAGNRAMRDRFPGEFDDYARPDWASRGIDLNEQVSEQRMREVLERSQAA